MFRELDQDKLSSDKQSAKVLYYPGATAADILKRLHTDDRLKNINPHNVNQVFLLCATNNVDRVLNVPQHRRTTIVELNEFGYNSHEFTMATEGITNLTNYLHKWAKSATINLINVIPRASRARNMVINDINLFIANLCKRDPYLNMIKTEVTRKLFSNNQGYRKDMYFNLNGADNVHLASSGIARLGSHLKYLAHHVQ